MTPSRFLYLGPYFEQPSVRKEHSSICQTPTCQLNGVSIQTSEKSCHLCHQPFVQKLIPNKAIAYADFLTISDAIPPEEFWSVLNHKIWIPVEADPRFFRKILNLNISVGSLEWDLQPDQVQEALEVMAVKFQTHMETYKATFADDLILRYGVLLLDTALV